MFMRFSTKTKNGSKDKSEVGNMSEASLGSKEVENKERRHAQIWKGLARHGIHTEEELNAAIKETKPLNIGWMVSPVRERKNEEKRGSR